MLPPPTTDISPESEQEAKKSKLYTALLGVLDSRWIYLSHLVNKAIDNNPKCDKKTYDKYREAFLTISKYFIKQPALVHYTKLLVKFMDSENTRKTYCKKLEDEILDRMLNVEEQQSRKRIKIVQTQTLNSELLAEINSSSTTAENDENDDNDDNDDANADDLINVTADTLDSVHDVIYEDGEKLHDKYKESEELTPIERKRMCSCLSGILDISDKSPNGQKLLFTSLQWDHLKQHYHQYGQLFRNKLNSDLSYLYKTWDQIHTTLVTDHSFFNARKTFNRLSSEEQINEHTFKQLQMLDCFLDSVDSKQFILNPRDSMNLTERDYESQIWVPLFTKLFNVKQMPLIRVKAGESVTEESTKKKAEQYKSDKNIIGFKVDVRLIHDHKSLEIDLASVEVSLPCADEAKLCHDESKLLRESAINTETVHHLLNGHESHVYTWSIRITGLAAVFSKVFYDDDNKIYVNVYQFTFYFPSCISELDNLKEDLDYLFKFKEDIEQVAKDVQKALKSTERRNYRNEDFSPERKPDPKPTPYFTPPRNEARRSVLSYRYD